MVIRAVMAAVLLVVSLDAGLSITGARLWQILDDGPLSPRPELILDRPSPVGAIRVTGGGPGVDPDDAAESAVDRLVAASGLDREHLVVALPTGSGWVDPAQVTALEEWAAGDVATVSTRYSGAPSAAVYLFRSDLATRFARALLTEVGERLDQLSPADRPVVTVHGASLGAYAGIAALADPGLAEMVDVALWQGVPGGFSDDSTGDAPCRVRALNPDDPVAALSWELLADPAAAVRTVAALPGSTDRGRGTAHSYVPLLPPQQCVSSSGADAGPVRPHAR